MLKLYAWNVGWVGGYDPKQKKIYYTQHRRLAKTWDYEEDPEFEEIARAIEHEGTHLDKVNCSCFDR